MKPFRLVLPAVLLLLCCNAFAGAYNGIPVFINDQVEHVAGGNLYATRFETDGNEYIGCALGSGTRGTYGYCTAFDGSTEVGCVTYDQKILNVIASINTFSWVYFEWGNKFEGYIGGVVMYECLHVTIATRSNHIPDVLAPPTP